MLPEAIHKLIPAAVGVQSATVTGIDPLMVDTASGVVQGVSWMPTAALGVGDRVLVVLSGGWAHVVGSAADRPQLATVQSVGAGSVTVASDTGLVLPGVPTVGAVATGDRVVLAWGNAGAVVVGVVTQTVPEPPPSTAPVDPTSAALPAPVTAASGAATQPAITVCTARSGGWRTDGGADVRAYQGHWTSGISADNIGYLFYGGGLSVPGAEVDGAATIKLCRYNAAGMGAPAEVRVALHAAHTKPTAPPALIGSPVVIGSIAAGATATLPLPESMAQALLDGTAGGLALTHPGTANYLAIIGPTGTPSMGDAGLITIPYLIGA